MQSVMDWLKPYTFLIIAGFAALAAFLILFMVIRRTRKPKNAIEKINIEPNTEVEDAVLGTVYEYIDWRDNPPGYPLLDNAKYYYYVRRPRGIKFLANDDGTMPDYSLYSLNLPKEMGILPEFLWRATHRPTQLVPILFELPPPAWIQEIMKYTVIALAIGALIFIVAKGK